MSQEEVTKERKDKSAKRKAEEEYASMILTVSALSIRAFSDENCTSVSFVRHEK